MRSAVLIAAWLLISTLLPRTVSAVPVTAVALPDGMDINAIPPLRSLPLSWVGLDCSFPPKAETGESRRLYELATGYPYPARHFNQRSLFAAGYNREGLWFFFEIEDFDVQGNKSGKNDWIWVEDVAELLIAGLEESGWHAEIQVNPRGTTFVNIQTGTGTLPEKTGNALEFKSAARVDGSINDASALDKGWCAVIMLPWESLVRAGLAPAGFKVTPGMELCRIKAASWDLNTCYITRINRCLPPSTRDIHRRENFNTLILK